MILLMLYFDLFTHYTFFCLIFLKRNHIFSSKGKKERRVCNLSIFTLYIITSWMRFIFKKKYFMLQASRPLKYKSIQIVAQKNFTHAFMWEEYLIRKLFHVYYSKISSLSYKAKNPKFKVDIYWLPILLHK